MLTVSGRRSRCRSPQAQAHLVEKHAGTRLAHDIRNRSAPAPSVRQTGHQHRVAVRVDLRPPGQLQSPTRPRRCQSRPGRLRLPDAPQPRTRTTSATILADDRSKRWPIDSRRNDGQPLPPTRFGRTNLGPRATFTDAVPPSIGRSRSQCHRTTDRRPPRPIKAAHLARCRSRLPLMPTATR